MNVLALRDYRLLLAQASDQPSQRRQQQFLEYCALHCAAEQIAALHKARFGLTSTLHLLAQTFLDAPIQAAPRPGGVS
ncbi:hypothetical protein WJX72_000275 [[Myrmecia] bisecta]|uniref:Uncharacterized protein n=1 Tax=[Myrmecia] bisecta TaxID=41462 RepID=A0AAW1QDW7_9CHLO